MASEVYTSAKAGFENGSLVFGGPIKLLFVNSGYTYNAAHDFLNDVTGEVTTGGVVRVTLSNPVVIPNNTDKRDYYDADDFVVPSTDASAGTITGAIIFKDTGVAGTSPLICYIELTPFIPGDEIQFAFHSSGIFYGTYGAYFVTDFSGTLEADWTNHVGTFSTSGGQLVPSSTGAPSANILSDNSVVLATVNVGATDGRLRVTIPTLGTDHRAVIARYVDDQNFWMDAVQTDNNLVLYRRQSGTDNVVDADFGVGFSNGDTYLIILNGDNIQCYRNGGLTANVTNSALNTATRFGLLAAGTTPRFDDFSFKSLTATWSVPAPTVTSPPIARPSTYDTPIDFSSPTIVVGLAALPATFNSYSDFNPPPRIGPFYHVENIFPEPYVIKELLSESNDQPYQGEEYIEFDVIADDPSGDPVVSGSLEIIINGGAYYDETLPATTLAIAGGYRGRVELPKGLQSNTIYTIRIRAYTVSASPTHATKLFELLTYTRSTSLALLDGFVKIYVPQYATLEGAIGFIPSQLAVLEGIVRPGGADGASLALLEGAIYPGLTAKNFNFAILHGIITTEFVQWATAAITVGELKSVDSGGGVIVTSGDEQSVHKSSSAFTVASTTLLNVMSAGVIAQIPFEYKTSGAVMVGLLNSIWASAGIDVYGQASSGLIRLSNPSTDYNNEVKN